MLRDLTIQNYRLFKDFHIDELARVNLIVGKNNSGKTSLLESIYLLVEKGDTNVFLKVLCSRDDSNEYYDPSFDSVIKRGLLPDTPWQISNLFHDHNYVASNQILIKSNKDQDLRLRIILDDWQRIEISQFDKFSSLNFPPAFGLLFLYTRGKINLKNLIPVDKNGLIQTSHLLNVSHQSRPQAISNQFIVSTNLSYNQLASSWDKISLTSEESTVIKALQIVEPDVERINFLSQPTSLGRAIVRLKGRDKPVPLNVMGDGMRRILGLAITTVTSEDGVLLVDEIDTGLHYQTQTDMWRLIVKTAQRLNVQVFATTHSWDCISAFQEVLSESSDPSVGKLFRLSARGEEIRAIPYTAEELAVAVPESIEVR